MSYANKSILKGKWEGLSWICKCKEWKLRGWWN